MTSNTEISGTQSQFLVGRLHALLKHLLRHKSNELTVQVLQTGGKLSEED
jgi:hypothetical protein